MEAYIDGVRLAYDDSGDGTPVLLIHGFPLCRKLWQPQTKALVTAGYRVIAPDLRGFGESDAPEGPYSMDLFADDLVSLMDFLHLDKAVIGGMSMGGYILLNLLSRYPKRVAAALFLQTRPNADDDAAKARRLDMARQMKALGPQVVADAFIPMLFSDESLQERPKLVDEVYGWMMKTSSNGLAGGLLAMRERDDYTGRLNAFTHHSLAIGGELDKIVPPPVTRLFGESMPDCRTVLLPDAGHMANLEAPNAFNNVLLSFLGELTGRSFQAACC